MNKFQELQERARDGWLRVIKMSPVQHVTLCSGGGVDTHQVLGVLGPHVWYQAVLCQCPLKDDLDPCRVTLLLLIVNIGLIFC